MDNLQINWADHLDIARCCEAIAEYDLGESIAAMGGSLALLLLELDEAAGHSQSGHSPENVSTFAISVGTQGHPWN